MYYKELLRVRGALITYSIVLGILLVISILITLSTAGHVSVTVGNDASHAAAVARAKDDSGAVPLLALLGFATMSAAIMATVLGSSLSQENDGHLEFACTKPCSRTSYATTLIAIDLAAIVVSLVIAFACALALFSVIIAHKTGAYLLTEPDTAANVARFALFPLAWYAIIAGLSAGMRGHAGIVQGLIWPLTLGLMALRHAPVPGVWHTIFTALNAINPLIYVSYQSKADVAIVGASPLHVLWSTVILALFIVVGWVAATVQWRRVEA